MFCLTKIILIISFPFQVFDKVDMKWFVRPIPWIKVLQCNCFIKCSNKCRKSKHSKTCYIHKGAGARETSAKHEMPRATLAHLKGGK